MPFQSGQSGNPGGRKTEKAITDAIRMALSDTHEATGKKKLRVLANKLVDKAIEGDVAAIKEVADRMEGKPVQQQILSGDPDAPLNIIKSDPLTPQAWAAQYGKASNQD